MELTVNKVHIYEGTFPTFKKGTKIEKLEECKNFSAWYSCEIEGYSTYIHEDYFKKDILVEDYNPTELNADIGDKLILVFIKNSWLYCKNKNGISGWIPADNVKVIV